jgi:hypothetical protein
MKLWQLLAQARLSMTYQLEEGTRFRGRALDQGIAPGDTRPLANEYHRCCMTCAEDRMMDDFGCAAQEHYLFGTVRVQVMCRRTRQPLEGVLVRVANSPEAARGMR